MKEGHFLNERYLEYRLEKADGSLDDNEVSLYFERDTGDSLLENKLFFTFSEWNKLNNFIDSSSFEDKLASLIYDRVDIVFDVFSSDCASLSNRLSKAYDAAEIKMPMQVQDYLRNGNRFVLSQLSSFFSGVGQILFYKMENGKKINKGKFFFAINEMPRIKVDYVIKNTDMGVDIQLECKNKGAKLNLLLLENNMRYPCLAGDKSSAIGGAFEIDFSASEVVNKVIAVPPNKRKSYYALALANENDEKYYLLNLLYEDSFPEFNKGREEPLDAIKVCPYCGSKIRDKKVATAYEEGAICCHVLDATHKMPEILKKNGDKEERVIFCQEDLELMEGKYVFNPQFLRTLPVDYYEHINCKVALLGSVRAGKTTFLSRFFGLTMMSNRLTMNSRHLTNAMARFNVSVTPARAPKLTPIELGKYNLADYNYYSEANFYKERAINLDTGAFPMATASGVDCKKYPFTLEVNTNGNRAYVNFYDIPGEDARTKGFAPFIDQECGGVFIFINSVKDVEGNTSIINAIKAAKLAKDTPIAVCLAKSDLIENKFLPSAHILRTDYYDLDKNLPFEKGIGREILCASMEIKSYLQAESMITDLENTHRNVMYFAVSSFNFSESIHTPTESPNDPGRLQFEDGTKRMELPFLWMLRQFGIYR